MASEKSEEQKCAEAEVDRFRKNRGPFVVAAEATRMAMVFTDATDLRNPVIFANDSFLSLTGYGREEVLGKSFNFFLAHGADTEALALIKSEFEGKAGSGVEVLYRRNDGSEFWAAVLISPVRDESGDIVQYFASFVDLTKHKDEATKSKFLIDELNHRVKNILATVQSIVWHAMRTASDPIKVIQQAIEARLFALSRSHDLLTRENWESAGLLDIIHDALQPFGVADGRAERIVLTGENTRFPPKAALALGIVFNELATNAVKYGALSNEGGSIRIEWMKEPTLEAARVRLHWQERGGPPVAKPSRMGFGSRVIERALAHELGGTSHLDYLSDGLACTMTIPISRIAHDG